MTDSVDKRAIPKVIGERLVSREIRLNWYNIDAINTNEKSTTAKRQYYITRKWSKK